MNDYVNFLNLEYFFARVGGFLKAVYDFFFPSDAYSVDVTNNLRGGTYQFFAHFGENWPIYAFLFTISLLFLLLLVYSVSRRKELEEIWEEKYKNHFIKPSAIAPKNPVWEKIQKLFESGNPSDWRVAIIEADALLDKLIVDLGYRGETMGERMQNIHPSDFPMLNAAWEAHKVRNRIAHEGMEYHIDAREAHNVYRLYESVFRDANYI